MLIAFKEHAVLPTMRARGGTCGRLMSTRPLAAGLRETAAALSSRCSLPSVRAAAEQARFNKLTTSPTTADQIDWQKVLQPRFTIIVDRRAATPDLLAAAVCRTCLRVGQRDDDARAARVDDLGNRRRR